MTAFIALAFFVGISTGWWLKSTFYKHQRRARRETAAIYRLHTRN